MAGSTKAAPAVKRPVHEVRMGRIKAAIWENETAYGVRHSVTLERLYTDAEGNWQHTRTFNDSDLPTLAALLHAPVEQKQVDKHADPREDQDHEHPEDLDEA